MASGDLRRSIKRAAILTLSIIAIAYGFDYVSFSYHIPASRTLLSTIEIKVFYMMPRKDGRLEVSEGDTENQICAHTLFSHAGYPPCWRTKQEKWIDLR
jgi:hypothetical protein